MPFKSKELQEKALIVVQEAYTMGRLGLYEWFDYKNEPVCSIGQMAHAVGINNPHKDRETSDFDSVGRREKQFRRKIREVYGLSKVEMDSLEYTNDQALYDEGTNAANLPGMTKDNPEKIFEHIKNMRVEK